MPPSRPFVIAGATAKQRPLMLGILTLDTAFPRIAGDVGCPATFAFPVRIKVVHGASVDHVVHTPQDALLDDFIGAARDLVNDGCTAITTTCGFLVRWQHELADAVPVPVLTSPLLALPLVTRTLGAGRRAGIVTYSAADLGADMLAAAGAAPDTPVAGVVPDGYFARTIRFGAPTLDRARMGQDVVAAAQALVARHPDVGAIVLECANMPPYATEVAAATRLPVHDAATLVTWFATAVHRR